MSRFRIGGGLALLALGLALSVGTAMAADSSIGCPTSCVGPEVEQVSPATAAPGSEEPMAVSTAAPASAETAPAGALPFTGGDVAGLVVVGAVAVGAGTVLVRRSRTRAN